MDALTAVLLLLVGLGAGFVQRVSGFGLGIFAMLFMPHFMPSSVAAVSVSCLFSCGTSTYNAVKYTRTVPFKTVLPMLIAALSTIPVAVYFSKAITGEIFEIILGIALIAFSLYFLFFNHRITMRRSVKNGVLAGALGGTLNGLFSTGGPPVVLYLSQVSATNAEYFAGIQFYFCVTNIYATVFRAVNGLLTTELLLLAAVGLVGCMIGDFWGSLVFDRLNTVMLKRIIYIGMIISGVLMFV